MKNLKNQATSPRDGLGIKPAFSGERRSMGLATYDDLGEIFPLREASVPYSASFGERREEASYRSPVAVACPVSFQGFARHGGPERAR